MTTDREKGFTLVELLVAIVVLGILMALLFGALRFGTRAWERTDTAISEADDVRLAQSLFRQSIERACPRRPYKDTPAVVDFRGASGDVSFLAPAPQALNIAGCTRIEFQSVAAGGERDLVYAVQDADRVRSRPLLHNLQSIEFAYLDPGTDGSPAVWLSAWTNRNKLPALVRLRVTFPADNTRVWPEILVAPRISAEADCLYNRTTQSCGGN